MIQIFSLSLNDVLDTLTGMRRDESKGCAGMGTSCHDKTFFNVGLGIQNCDVTKENKRSTISSTNKLTYQTYLVHQFNCT